MMRLSWKSFGVYTADTPASARRWRSSSGMIPPTTTVASTPSARDEDPDVIGLSILSGSHLSLVPTIVDMLRAEGVEAPVIVGGIIPESDRQRLADAGVSAVYTPKDFQMARIMDDVAHLAAAHRAAP